MYTVIQGLGKLLPFHIMVYSIPRHVYQYYTWQRKHLNQYLLNNTTNNSITVYIIATMLTHH